MHYGANYDNLNEALKLLMVAFLCSSKCQEIRSVGEFGACVSPGLNQIGISSERQQDFQ